MNRAPLGLIILVAVSILIYFGLAQRLLDRMRLSDKAALAVIAALIVGSFIDIPIMRGRINASLNAGGALVPLGLAAYLLGSAGTTREWLRALVATIATTAVIFLAGSMVSGDPRGGGMLIDPLYLYPLVGGVAAYLVGRSRRAAFVAATIGVLGLDIVHWVWLGMTGTPGDVNIGGAGAFDSVVVAGLVAVLLAELIGETRERLQGGPAEAGRDPRLISNLKGIGGNGNDENNTTMQDEPANSITVKEKNKGLEGEDK